MVAVAKVVMEVDSDMVAVEVLVMATSKMVWQWWQWWQYCGSGANGNGGSGVGSAKEWWGLGYIGMVENVSTSQK